MYIPALIGYSPPVFNGRPGLASQRVSQRSLDKSRRATIRPPQVAAPNAMNKANRSTFVVSVALICLSGLVPVTAVAQGWSQHVAMWHPQPWPTYQPAIPDGHWAGQPQIASPQIKAEEPPPRGTTRAQRSAAKERAPRATQGEMRATKAKAFRNRGMASWYGKRFHGRKTASGQRYDMHAMTAAHRTLPIPSYVRVSNPANGASVVVLINDRGPYVRNRIIDLSYAAATALGITKRGTATVELDVIPNTLPTLASADHAPQAEVAPALTVPTAID